MLSAPPKVETVRPPATRSPRLSSSLRVLLLLLILLVPNFWQRRIQAADLGSHIYNSWLAEQVQLNRAPGLILAPLTSNVLFDLELGALYGLVGAEPAQRIAVSLTVLIFFWGAFAFVSAASGLRPWY